MSVILFRIMGWALLIGIVVLTVVPPSLRIVTGASHNLEHALVFLLTGVVFGLGYELRISVMCTAAVLFCACVEIVQLAVPGRHARLSDFVIDAAAACIGIAIGWTVHRVSEGFAFANGAVRQSIPIGGKGPHAHQRKSNAV